MLRWLSKSGSKESQPSSPTEPVATLADRVKALQEDSTSMNTTPKLKRPGSVEKLPASSIISVYGSPQQLVSRTPSKKLSESEMKEKVAASAERIAQMKARNKPRSASNSREANGRGAAVESEKAKEVKSSPIEVPEEVATGEGIEEPDKEGAPDVAAAASDAKAAASADAAVAKAIADIEMAEETKAAAEAKEAAKVADVAKAAEKAEAAKVARALAREKAKADEEAQKERAMTSKMKAMSGDELIAMHLEDRLGADRTWGTERLERVTSALRDNETKSSALASETDAKREEREKQIAILDERHAGFEKAVALNSTLYDQTTKMSSEIVAAAQLVNDGLEDRKTVCCRVDNEIEESQERLLEQAKVCQQLQTDLTIFNTTTAPTIAKSGVELMKLTSEASAKTRSLQIWNDHLEIIRGELRELKSLTDDSVSLDAKASRLDETRAQLAEVQERINKDEADLAERTQAEKDLTEIDHAAELEAANVRRSLCSDSSAVGMLMELQAATIELDLDPQSGSTLPITQGKLFGETRIFLEERKEISSQCKADLDQKIAAHDQSVDYARDERAKQMKMYTAERAAIEIAHEQRKRFLDDKQRQLEVEQKEVDKARCELLDRQYKMEMLKKEITEAEAIAALRSKALQAAEKAKQYKQSAITKFILKSKLRAASINAKLQAEREVQVQQQGYVTALVKKQAIERDLAAKAKADEDSHTRDGARHPCLAAPIGARGQALIKENNEKHKGYITKLQDTGTEVSEDLGREKAELAMTLKESAQSEAMVKEQHSALQHTMTKLSDYMANLFHNLPSNPASPRSALLSSPIGNAATLSPLPLDSATSPLRRSRKQLFDESPIASPHRIDAVVLSENVAPEPVSALPSKEALSTPYAAAHKYLAQREEEVQSDEIRSGKDALEKISQQILSEQNHPLFNPDLKVAPDSGGWFRSSTTVMAQSAEE